MNDATRDATSSTTKAPHPTPGANTDPSPETNAAPNGPETNPGEVPPGFYEDPTPMTLGQGRMVYSMTARADLSLRRLRATLEARLTDLEKTISEVPEAVPGPLDTYIVETTKAISMTLSLVRDTHVRLTKIEAHLFRT